MTRATPPPIAPALDGVTGVTEGQPADEGLGALFGRAVADAKAYARAEFGYWQALAGARLSAARTGLVLAVAALLLALALPTALVIGLILTLATLVGPGWATLIVILAVALVAGLLGWLGWARLKRALASEA
jgi:hypothetical protein